MLKSKIKFAVFAIVAFLSAFSCMERKPADTKEIAEELNEQNITNNDKEKDAQFLVDASEINRNEIMLGQLAQQKSKKTHIKEVGKMMEDDHTKSLAEVTVLAKAKNINLPTSQTENGQEAYKKLSVKSGNDFDKEFSDMMVNGHKDAIALFENASTKCTDPEIKAWANATLPTLKTHLEHSLMCQKECEKM